MGLLDLMRKTEQDRSRGIFFTQDWASMPGDASGFRWYSHLAYAGGWVQR